MKTRMDLRTKKVVAGGGSPLQAGARGDAVGLAKISEVIAEPGPNFVGPTA
jgi:hypothetical protein